MTRTRLAPVVAVLLAVGLVSLAGCGGGSPASGSSARAASTTSPASLHVAPVPSGRASPAAAPSTAPSPSASAAPSPAPSPAGPTLPSGTFTRTFGGRSYSLRVPPNATGPLRLVVCFHGAGDDFQNFGATLQVAGWLAAADKAGVALLVPETLSPYADFANWSGNPNNDFAAMQTELDSILALVDHDVSPTWPIDPARTHALGFSDGGLFVAVVGLAAPRFASDTILSYGWGGFNIQPSAGKPPVHMACGTLDGFYPAAQATQAFLAGDGHEVLWEPVANVDHDLLGVSAGIDPAKALAWIAARPK